MPQVQYTSSVNWIFGIPQGTLSPFWINKGERWDSRTQENLWRPFDSEFRVPHSLIERVHCRVGLCLRSRQHLLVWSKRPLAFIVCVVSKKSHQYVSVVSKSLIRRCWHDYYSLNQVSVWVVTTNISSRLRLMTVSSLVVWRDHHGCRGERRLYPFWQVEGSTPKNRER